MAGGKSEYSWAIAAIGAALVAVFLAAGATGAAGHDIPTELWAAAGALSGALVGVLVPAPATGRGALAGAAVINAAAVRAATVETESVIKSGAGNAEDCRMALAKVIATSTLQPGVRQRNAAITETIASHQTNALGAGSIERVAADAAKKNEAKATSAANAATRWSAVLDGGKIVVPAIVAIAAFYVGIRMADGRIGYAGCAVLHNLKSGQTEAPCASTLFGTANAMIALGVAAAGALVGLFAPTPVKAAATTGEKSGGKPAAGAAS